MNPGAKRFAGIRITADRYTALTDAGLRRVHCRKGVYHLLFDRFGEVGWGGNSGFHALNLAIQFGARAVVLVGFDMSLDHGYHWHGRHPAGLNNPKQAGVDKWRLDFDAQRPVLDAMGITVLVGSPNSRLTAFPKLGFKESISAARQSLHDGRASD